MINNQTNDESAYLLRFKDGDSRAFRFFFDRYWETLYTAAFRHVRDEHVAKDVVQEVFIQVWEKRHLINTDYTSLHPYLSRAVKNKVLNHYASEHVRKEVLDNMLHRIDLYDTMHGHTAARYQELEGMVDEAVAKLPKLMQAVYLMRNDQYSIQQIAKDLNIAEQTVKNYLSDAKKILKQELSKRFTDHEGLLMIFVGSCVIHDFLM